MTTLERSVLGRLRRRGPLTPGGFSAQQLTDAGADVVLSDLTRTAEVVNAILSDAA